MREINVADITQVISELCIEANYYLDEDVLESLQKAFIMEESPIGKNVLQELIANAKIAKEEQVPLCQDTGFTVIFIELGQDVRLVGGDLYDAINKGVREGYIKGHLRKSIVTDPINRINTKDNTPAVIHLDIVPGDKMKITLAPKGGGSENMSAVKMLKPSEGSKGVVDFVVDTVKKAGSNPCPPIILGVGIGGTFEKVSFLAKKALLRKLGQPNPNPFYEDMEREIFCKVNKTGIGPQGFGGRITTLAVHIETYPAHIATLPVAVNINCHSSRHRCCIL